MQAIKEDSANRNKNTENALKTTLMWKCVCMNIRLLVRWMNIHDGLLKF
jgi:hypothetical protein